MGRESFLTEKQIIVLKLRSKGLTLEEIAKELGTSKQNVYAIEKAAHENIAKAERTLKIARLIKAPIWISAKKGDDLDSIVGCIYKKADEKGIHVIYDGPSLLYKIKEESRGGVKGRKIVADIEIGITEDGDIIVV